jgi:hypothetical protein
MIGKPIYCKTNVKSSPATRHGGTWGERRYSSYSFSTSALDGGEWSASRPGRAFTPGTHCTGGWVGPRAGLDTEAEGSGRVTMDWVQLASLGSNIQRRSQVVNIPSYSTGPGFNSRPGDRHF